jgi:hypothetical protein
VVSLSAGYTATTLYANAAATTYSVNVKDANGCVFTKTVTVSNTSGPTAQTVTTTNTSCGSSNGSLTIGVTTGGTSPFTYSLNGGAYSSTTSYINLSASTYTVTVKDANSCTYSRTTTVSNSASGPSAISASSTPSTCSNANGVITIGTVTGGTAPFSYSVSSIGTGFTSTTTFTAIPSGTYTVTVNDANSCTYSVTTNVSNIPGPTGFTINPVNATCGNANGSIAIGNVTGGTSPYTYSLNGGAFSANTNYSNLSAGAYTVTVKDANNCIYSSNTTITTTNPPTDIAISTSNPGCLQSNGVIALGSVTSGTSPFTYSFNGGSYAATTLYLNLAAGTYSISVKDANNCIFITSTTLTAPPTTDPTFNTIQPLCAGASFSLPTTSTNGINGNWQPPINNQNTTTYTFTPNSGQCANTAQLTVLINQLQIMASSSVTDCGSNSGFVRVDSVIGGVAPFSYQLNNGTPQSDVLFQNLAGGNFSVSVTDNNGCTANALMNIASVQALALNLIGNNTSCAPLQSASIVANPTGGTAPYQFFWLNSSNTNPSLSVNTAGTYSCVVNDVYGCSKLESFAVNALNPLSVSLTSTNTDCGLNTGSATATVSGGTPPYVYQWTSGSQLPQATELASGQYVVQVYDANNCNTSEVVNINASNGPVVTVVSLQNASCSDAYDANVNLSISGGIPPYTYSWNTGNTDPFLTNMPAGYYDFTVTDASNCQVVQSYTLTAPPAIEITSTTQEPPCGSSTGSITANASNGVAPYTYQWSATAGAQTTQTATNLPADNYFVTVTDANNCSQSYYTNLSNSNNNIQIQVDNVQRSTCGSLSTGAISITATGGAAPFTYAWNNGSTSEDLSNLPAGEYVVRVGDALGCVAYSAIRVEPEVLNYQPEICVVTVDTALSRNLIVWEKPPFNGIKSYKLYRETSTNNYQLLAEVPFASESKYTDMGANPAVRSWRYKLSAVDSCDVETPLSSKHKTIHLVQFPSLGGSNSLIWDFYDGYSYDYFYIWRDDPTTGWMNIDSMPSNLTSYTDLTPPSIDSRYMIEIIPPTPCVSTLKLANGGNNEMLTTVVKSKSNIRNNRQQTVGVKSITKGNLKVYPNPAQHQFTIDLQQLQSLSNGFEIVIENTLGQRIYENTTKQNKLQVNISQYQPGVYFVKVKTAQGTMLEKVVVE